MDSHSYDRYYEYLEQKRESEEMDEWVARRDAERERVLATLTKEERALLDKLNDNMNKAYKKLCLLQNRSLRATADYNNARTAYRKAAEKWPILKDGY